jgi:hypothetical protein
LVYEGIRRARRNVSGTRFYRHRGADARRKRRGTPYEADKSAENPDP